jgi:predicted O-linked N-acetylglucosamine transferase (SPINDLY family)
MTFAALNRLVKVTPTTIRLWARVLQGVPGSRLMVLVGRGCERDKHILELFASNGIGPDQLLPVGRRPRAEYLRLYWDADIALDTFPYTGHTTTLDAAWMGVPTVSLAGATHVQRAGLSVMSALGLAEDLVGHSPEQYVQKAVSLASNLGKLARLRLGLRGRMAASSLCDGPRMARALEEAYRAMWAQCCAGCRFSIG